MTGQQQPPFKAVIFDWDLTLWNSWDIHLDLMRQTADHLGHPRPTHGELGREYSRPFLQHLAWFFPGDQEQVEETYLRFYWSSVWEADRLYPGVQPLLRELKESGYLTALLSDKRTVFGHPELEHSQISGLLDAAFFLADGQPYKPDPSRLLEVAEELGVDPSECLFVGDSQRDIECAQRAGAGSGAALWATVEREKVLSLDPQFRWEQVDEVRATLMPPGG